MQKYDKYKNSGVDWIGEIPEHWSTTRLANLLTNVSIKNREELPLLSITREKGVILRNLDDDEDNHNFIPDDLSGYKMIRRGQFGMNKMKAWQGSYGVSDYDGIVSPAYFIFNLSEKIHAQYFHKAIRSKLYVSFFGSASDGVRIGQWDLSKSRMKEIPFLIPDMAEQKAIATFLDDKTSKIDQTISLKQKEITLLKERRQILIQKAVTKGLNEQVKMKDSGVDWSGEIPEHWEVRKLKYLVKKSFSGGTPSTDKLSYWDGGIPWISSVDVKLNNLFQTTREISLEGLKNSSSKMASKGTLVFVTRSGILQHTFPTSILQRDMAINQDIKCLVFHEFFSANYFQKIIVGNNSEILVLTRQQAATVESINMEAFFNLFVPVMSKQEQSEIVQFCNKIEEKIAKVISIKQQEIEKLKEYKAVLIDNVVSGKVKVFA